MRVLVKAHSNEGAEGKGKGRGKGKGKGKGRGKGKGEVRVRVGVRVRVRVRVRTGKAPCFFVVRAIFGDMVLIASRHWQRDKKSEAVGSYGKD